jgi:hypothetical protein
MSGCQKTDFMALRIPYCPIFCEKKKVFPCVYVANHEDKINRLFHVTLQTNLNPSELPKPMFLNHNILLKKKTQVICRIKVQER